MTKPIPDTTLSKEQFDDLMKWYQLSEKSLPDNIYKLLGVSLELLKFLLLTKPKHTVVLRRLRDAMG